MSHTKGEWRATPINTVVAGEKGRQIAIMQRCGRPQKEITANARLIAAAPDLLTACEKNGKMLVICARVFLGTSEKPDPMELADVILKNDVAVAKAKKGSK